MYGCKIKKKRAGLQSRTSADVTARKRKAAMAKYDNGKYKQKMMKLKSKTKYKGMKGMKYS